MINYDSIFATIPVYRFLHINNLEIYLKRGALHAPNHSPEDGLIYKPIHSTEVQSRGKEIQIPCGPKGSIHDYVPFYFSHRSPMLLQLKTGRVMGYTEGQEPLIYIVSTIQQMASNGTFVFSDGHGVAQYTQWYDELISLDKVDWNIIKARYWEDTKEDPDRQRRKQAEFLVHKKCEWLLMQRIAVMNQVMKERVQEILSGYPENLHLPIEIQPRWYY